ERYPASNLSADVAGLLAAQSGGPLRLRMAPLPPEAWLAGRSIPENYSALLAGRSDLRLYRNIPALPGSSGGVVPTILQAGASAPGWDAASAPFPGEQVFWEPTMRELRAVAAAPPRGIQLEVPVEAAAELGSVELRLAAVGAAADAAAGTATSAAP